MHILLVNNSPIPVYGYGGTERVIWDLGKTLVQQGPPRELPGARGLDL